MKEKTVKALIMALSVALFAGCSGKTNSSYESASLAAGKSLSSLNKIEAHYTTKNNAEMFIKNLEHRDGKIVVEILNGTVLDNEGNGRDDAGYYMKYNEQKFNAGDRVQSIFIYDSDTNYIDSIIYRQDVLVQ